jgi:anti-anti-sigma regulatory factor
VEKMDSSALGIMLILLDRAKAVGKEVFLSKANSYVTNILDIASFENNFIIR